MTNFFRKTIALFFIGLLATSLLMRQDTLAQEEPVEGSDPAITNLWVINSSPAPNGLVDLTVFFTNVGTESATNVSLRIDYDEAQLNNLSLGSPDECHDDGEYVICNYNYIDPDASHTIGFTARVNQAVQPGTIIMTYASISASENEVIINDHQTIAIDVTSAKEGGVISPIGLGGTVLIDSETGALEEPAENQGIVLFNVQSDPNWKTSSLTTSGLKFMIRGKEALAWSLNIEDSGFDNPAIRTSYNKVLTVVNSLFIIGLLAIAAMWMFSILIPRRYLRQVILVYALAVVFVNFALPLNQLFIDGTNLLQKAFLGDVNISNIVETPNYNDPTSVGYQNETNFIKQADIKTFSLNLPQENAEMNDVIIGKLQQNFLSPSFQGTISYLMQDGDGNQQQVTENITLHAAGNDPLLSVNASQAIELVGEKSFNPDVEHSIFAFLMMLFTGLAYFGMALIFILRIVLLWALMIVSPVLFLLAIFHATRSYFFNWLGVYARWLLIGPLMALGLGIVVGIWKTVGLPVISSYQSLGQFGNLSNIGFYLPGKEAVNNLSTTQQMMEYLLFLIMLYLPILFAFMLTRQKLWSSAAMAVAEKHEALKATATATATAVPTTEEETKKTKTTEGSRLLPGGIRGFLGSKLSGLTKPTEMPKEMRGTEVGTAPPLETASSFLPEHLALSGMRDMLGLVAGTKDSRHAHGNAIEKLANPEGIADTKEQQNALAVRQEISNRADQGDAEAVRIMSEIKEVETQTFTERETATGEPTVVEPKVEVKVELPKDEKESMEAPPLSQKEIDELEGEESESEDINPRPEDEPQDDETDNSPETDEK